MFTWFITGASRGLGRHLVEAALTAGDAVVAAARAPSDLIAAQPGAGGRLHAVALDVTDPSQAEEAVRSAVDTLGRLDVVVNNAGYGLFGAVEEISDTEARAIFDTNVFGLLNVTRAALPILRSQKRGHLINIGSSAGFAAGAARGLYGASKSAVEGLSEALRDELAPLGVRVTLVEPGSFRTEFLSDDSVRRPEKTIDDYMQSSGKVLEAIGQSGGKQPGDPEKAAQAIRSIVAADEPPFRLQLGSDCVSLVETKVESVETELATWRHLALSTDF